MADSGFGTLDFLQCCKFAEGDSRILMQKLARDRFKEWKNGSFSLSGGSEEEVAACEALDQGLLMHTSVGGMDASAAWNKEWKAVYLLAEVCCCSSFGCSV